MAGSVPARTPPEIVQKMHADVATALADPLSEQYARARVRVRGLRF
jgi:hypothetical protein